MSHIVLICLLHLTYKKGNNRCQSNISASISLIYTNFIHIHPFCTLEHGKFLVYLSVIHVCMLFRYRDCHPLTAATIFILLSSYFKIITEEHFEISGCMLALESPYKLQGSHLQLLIVCLFSCGLLM